MTAEDKQYLLALQQVPMVGPVVAKNLVAYCGSPKAVFEKTAGFLRKIPEVGPKLVEQLKQDPAPLLKRAEEELAYMERHAIRMLAYSEAEYPQALKTIYNAPNALFVKGNYTFPDAPCIAIVGTRKPSDYGRMQAARFARYYAERGFCVVSGLAYGVDIAAHKAVLEAGGTTLAVLAHGLDRIYPGHHAQQAKAMCEKGALVSEYMTGTEPDATNFPARNRILSGLCQAVVVIEAAVKGGALITGRIGFDQNRNIYALPGRLHDPYSEGCNLLIRDQIAKLVTDPEEVLIDLNLSPDTASVGSIPRKTPLKAITDDLTAEEQLLLNLLEKQEAGLDELSYRSGMQPNRLVSLLLTLEFRGYVSQKPGRVFCRC